MLFYFQFSEMFITFVEALGQYSRPKSGVVFVPIRLLVVHDTLTLKTFVLLYIIFSHSKLCLAAAIHEQITENYYNL